MKTTRSARLLLLLTPLAAAVGCGGQTDTRPASWSYIATAIVQPSCATANCHSNLSQRSGVELDDILDGYNQLVGRHFVLPGRPDESALVGLIKGQGSRRMPPDFALPQDDIDLISRWIADGAAYTGPNPAAATMPVVDLAAGAGN